MSFLQKLHDISTFIFDVDGVLTNSLLHIQEDGSLLRQISTRDTFALRHAVKKGYRVVIITKGTSKGVEKLLQSLGIIDIYLGVDNKLELLRELIDLYSIDLGRSTYMGDDLPDYECMRIVQLATCPADACHEIREISQYISPLEGGKGCVRDIIEKVLRVQGQWITTAIVE